MRKYPNLRQVYEEILSKEWVANYRNNPPASSVQELGKTRVKMESGGAYSRDYFHNFDDVKDAAYSILEQDFYLRSGMDVDDPCQDLGIDHNEQQKIFDYLPLENILKMIDVKAMHEASLTKVIFTEDEEQEAALKKYEEEYQEGKESWEEEQSSINDPYGGYEPPNLSEGDSPPYYEGDDYSSYEEDLSEEKIEKKIEEDKRVEFKQRAYEKILSSEWVANYRNNPPASSVKELGEENEMDFKNKIHSLFYDLVTKDNFQPTPYQKLFDYLSLREVFTLIT